MKTTLRTLFSLVACPLLACPLFVGTALAQTATPPAPPTTPPASKPAPTPPPAEDPTLDDLLGIPGTKPAEKPADPATDTKTDTPKPDAPKPNDALDQQLSQDQSPEDFQQAVELMRRAEDRLARAKDAGIDTQRLQQDVLLKLDKLIAMAQQNQNQSSKSKSKSKQQKPDESQQQQQQSSQSQQQQQGQQQGAQAGDPSVAKQEGQGRTPAAGGAAAWGNLPEHIRDSLRQGRGDRFSSVYKSLTEQYYKRLAEDPAAARTGSPR